MLQPEALERARRLGGNVGAQLGRPYDEAEYLGDPGACPLCHLSVIALRGATAECATCGAVGLLRAGDDGVVFELAPDGARQSILSLAEKLDHFAEVQETAAQHAPMRDLIERSAREYAAWDPRIIPPRR